MWIWIGLFVGCGGSADEELLESLAGTWSGSAQVNGEALSVSATLDYASFLSGDVEVDEPEGLASYGIRRADAFNGDIDLDLQRSGEEQFLSLEGTLEGGAFGGEITKTFECGKPQPCGYVGTFSLTSEGPVDTGL